MWGSRGGKIAFSNRKIPLCTYKTAEQAISCVRYEITVLQTRWYHLYIYIYNIKSIYLCLVSVKEVRMGGGCNVLRPNSVFRQCTQTDDTLDYSYHPRPYSVDSCCLAVFCFCARKKTRLYRTRPLFYFVVQHDVAEALVATMFGMKWCLLFILSIDRGMAGKTLRLSYQNVFSDF